jgi:outer membrane protein
MRIQSLLTPLACAAALALAAPAQAQEAGDWTFSVGAHAVDPTSDNGTLAGGALSTDVDSAWSPTITAEYWLRPNWGIEILAALPFEHDIALNVAHAGSTRQLPPTVSLQYHFRGRRVTPFVGLGLNYTTFFEEETRGPLAGTELELDDSWGLAAHGGLDIAIGDSKWLRLDARWIDIDTDASVNGADVGTVEIDPWVYGAAFVWAF